MYKLFIIATLCVVCCLGKQDCKDLVKKNDITAITERDGAVAANGNLRYRLSEVVDNIRHANRVRVAFKLDDNGNFTIQEIHVKFKDTRLGKIVAFFEGEFGEKELKKEETDGKKTDTITFKFDSGKEVNKVIVESRCYKDNEDPKDCEFQILQMKLCKA